MEIANKAKAIIDAQVQKGLYKYGTTLDNNPADIHERIDHICEELADGLQYAIWIKKEIKEIKSEAYAQALYDLIERFDNDTNLTNAALVLQNEYHQKINYE